MTTTRKTTSAKKATTTKKKASARRPPVVHAETSETTYPLVPVTGVQVFPLSMPVGKTCAFARVMLADQLQLTGLRVVDGSNGLFVAYPNDPTYKGDDYRSLFYPTTKALREEIESKVLALYEEKRNAEIAERAKRAAEDLRAYKETGKEATQAVKRGRPRKAPTC
jgi:stage V sporulation protein G